MHDQYRLQFIGFKTSQKTNSSLDDTIPLDRNAPGFKLSETNQTFYGSEFSISTNDQSKDSSVKIVYEVINLESSKTDERNNRMVNLRFGKWEVSLREMSIDHRILRDSFDDSTDSVVLPLSQFYINMTSNKLFILTN